MAAGFKKPQRQYTSRAPGCGRPAFPNVCNGHVGSGSKAYTALDVVCCRMFSLLHACLRTEGLKAYLWATSAMSTQGPFKATNLSVFSCSGEAYEHGIAAALGSGGQLIGLCHCSAACSCLINHALPWPACRLREVQLTFKCRNLSLQLICFCQNAARSLNVHYALILADANAWYRPAHDGMVILEFRPYHVQAQDFIAFSYLFILWNECMSCLTSISMRLSPKQPCKRVAVCMWQCRGYVTVKMLLLRLTCLGAIDMLVKAGETLCRRFNATLIIAREQLMVGAEQAAVYFYL